MITDAIYQLTKDQTYVQFEMDAGRMTWKRHRYIHREMYFFSVLVLPSRSIRIILSDRQIRTQHFCYVQMDSDI